MPMSHHFAHSYTHSSSLWGCVYVIDWLKETWPLPQLDCTWVKQMSWIGWLVSRCIPGSRVMGRKWIDFKSGAPWEMKSGREWGWSGAKFGIYCYEVSDQMLTAAGRLMQKVVSGWSAPSRRWSLIKPELKTGPPELLLFCWPKPNYRIGFSNLPERGKSS